MFIDLFIIIFILNEKLPYLTKCLYALQEHFVQLSIPQSRNVTGGSEPEALVATGMAWQTSG